MHDYSSQLTYNLSGMTRLNGLALFQKSILNHFKFKKKSIILIPQQRLIYYRPNLFRRTYDFLVGWIMIRAQLVYQLIHVQLVLLDWGSNQQNL